MQESLLQYIWQQQLYTSSDLRTTEGEQLTVFHAGNFNEHGGPDFLQARIKIGQTEWAGNIEIHTRSSHWKQHQHQFDDAYKSVILHVVWKDDQPLQSVPTLVLEDRIPRHLLQRYEHLMNLQGFIPCEQFIADVPTIEIALWKDRMLTERLETKTARIKERLLDTKQDWNQVFYEQLAYNFGLKTNADAFLEVAKHLPLKILRKYHNNFLQIEALLFGTAGLLQQDFVDRYPGQLKKEFSFLQQKHNLKIIPYNFWNFGRVRPSSLPTIRLAQFSRLIFQSKALFSKLMQPISLPEIQQLFTVEPVDYWTTHYVFDKESKPRTKRIGQSKLHNIIINTIVPFQFIVGRLRNQPELSEQAIRLLEEIPKEKNKITKKWEAVGINHSSAFDSQALIHLYRNYCRPQRCLQCRIGHLVLKNPS